MRLDSTCRSDYAGSNAVDGNISSNASRRLPADTSGDDWIEIDLGEDVTINNVRSWTGYVGHNSPLPDYRLQRWNGSSWIDEDSRSTQSPKASWPRL